MKQQQPINNSVPVEKVIPDNMAQLFLPLYLKHPAVLKLIRYVAESGHKYGCTVGICGELGAETDLTEEFLKMGIDELSVSPSFLLTVRKKIREIDLS